MNNGKLIVFSGPSGSGKTTIVHHLLARQELTLSFSISATSRYKRPAETHGKDYYFLSVDEFKTKIRNDEFLEYEEVYADNFYGTLRSEIKRIWGMGKDAIFDVDVSGGLQIKKQFSRQTLSVFVHPPSIEVLEDRLRSRKTESDEKIAIRMAKASKELAVASAFDAIIINNDLEIAKREAYALVYDFIQ